MCRLFGGPLQPGFKGFRLRVCFGGLRFEGPYSRGLGNCRQLTPPKFLGFRVLGCFYNHTIVERLTFFGPGCPATRRTQSLLFFRTIKKLFGFLGQPSRGPMERLAQRTKNMVPRFRGQG